MHAVVGSRVRLPVLLAMVAILWTTYWLAQRFGAYLVQRSAQLAVQTQRPEMKKA